MKRFINFIICICIPIVSFSQTAYSKQASDCAHNGDYDKAIRLETKGLNQLEKSIGKDNARYINALYNLALYYSYIEKDDVADEIFNQIEQAPISIDVDEDYDYYDYYEILNLIATYYENLTEYDHAITIRTKLIPIMDNAQWDKDVVDYFGVLCRLNCDYIDSGRYKEALSLSLEMVDTYKQLYLKKPEWNKSMYSTSLTNLAETYSYLGNYDKAIELAKEALELVKEDDYESFPIMNNLANYYDEIEQYENALEIQNIILKKLSKYISEDNEEYIVSISLMGRYLVHSGNINEGISYINKAKDLWIKYQDKSHPYFQHILSSMVSAYMEEGRYEDAIKTTKEILINLKQIFGDNHPFVVESNIDLLLLYILTNNYNETKDVIKEVVPVVSNNIRYNFSFLPLDDRTKLWNRNKIILQDVIPTLNYRFPELSITGEGYNACMLAKGVLLNSERTFDEFLINANDSDLQKMYEDIKKLRQNINKLYSYPISERTVRVDSLANCLYSLENKLMERAYEHGDYTDRLRAIYEDVRNNLKEDEAAIEFALCTFNNETHYIAYILKKEFSKPILIDMFEERLITQWGSKNIYKSHEASNLIWGKLNPYLEGVKNVYFAPDGKLSQIAIEYLPDFDGEGLISERYNLYRVSSTRELVFDNRREISNEVAIFGGVLYDIEVSSMEYESRKYYGNTSLCSRSINSLIDSLGNRAGVIFLEHTKTEAEQISNMMNVNGRIATLFTGEKANEESFKNLSGKRKGIIHVATHGFYWEKDKAECKVGLNEKLSFMVDYGNLDKRNAEDKALTRTGLYMAGVNNILQGKEIPESIEDGILTAQEIANLDLRGLDLVVLSACQTGMGDISSDGVLGLQRGFKKAGANSILMSLWDVDDKATDLLMTEFYKNYLSGMSKQKSLNEAQRVVRETPGFKNPRYWAAFILLDGLN